PWEASAVVSRGLAAQQTISGKVTGNDGALLSGVSVSVVGGQTATSTDVIGNYSISAQIGATLHFTMIGYLSQDVIVSTDILNVTLAASDESLDEVVVVGYGTMKRSDLTGAIVTADLAAFKEAPNTNILQSIKGTLPGLQIGQTNQAGA